MRINTPRWIKRHHQLHAMKWFIRVVDVLVASNRTPRTYMARSWPGVMNGNPWLKLRQLEQSRSTMWDEARDQSSRFIGSFQMAGYGRVNCGRESPLRV